MKPLPIVLLSSAAILLTSAAASAAVRPLVEHHAENDAAPGFRFPKVPPPVKGDAGAQAKFEVIDGEADRAGAGIPALSDGRTANEADQPSRSFFFRAGADGGRLVADLGGVISVKQVNTYSWHTDSRAPQVYKLYASDGTAGGFNPKPKRGTDPTTCGWTLVSEVDTRPHEGEKGGQYGVSIANGSLALGRYRYLLFDISRTEDADPFGNTFYNEIDILDANAPQPAQTEAAPAPKVLKAENGKYQFTFDTSLSPDLNEWAEKELGPVIQEWYPKIVALLPSPGYEAPKRVMLEFREDMGGTPASAGGNHVNLNIPWFRRNLQGEAKGAVVHELVHIVQQYGRAPRSANATRPPGWIVEGIPDYIRWFLYEPQTHGAEITARNVSNARYDASYRVTGNFLNWVVGKYDKDLVAKINAAAREGRYNEDLWKERTGKTVQELGAEWKAAIEEKVKGGQG